MHKKFTYIRPRFYKTEAIKDELSKVQIDRAKELWGESILNYEKADPTDRIKQGKWILNEEDKLSVINKMFNTNLEQLTNSLNSVEFKEYLGFLKKSTTKEFNFDPNNFSFKDIVSLYRGIFRQCNVKETASTTKILKDVNGRPIKGEDGKIQKVEKSEDEKSEIFWNNNQVTDAIKLIANYNDYLKEMGKTELQLDQNTYTSSCFTNLYSLSEDGLDGDFKLNPTQDIYLYISHKSSDILNMSVSKFYSSCHELYTGGGNGDTYMQGLIYNLFDPNSMPAFLIFDEPYYDNNGNKLVDFMPLCRRMIRAIYDSDRKFKNLYFDQTYPDRISSLFKRIIQDYSENETGYNNDYDILYDLPESEETSRPYFDNADVASENYFIGLNTKKVTVKGEESNLIFGKRNNVEELTIKDFTSDVESLIKKMPKLKFISFESMELRYLPDNFNFGQVKLNKCIVNETFIEDISKLKDFKKLWIQSCFMDFNLIGELSTLEELTVMYMNIDTKVFEKLINLKLLNVSDEIYKKLDLKSLTSRGIKINKVGR